MGKIKSNINFGKRVFLTKEEWETYLRRKPVRYIKKDKKDLCEICGKPETKENKFQNAHRIPFGIGVADFGLTPDYLDSDKNIRTAHKVVCNKKAELSLKDICKQLKEDKVTKLPNYLSDFIRELFNNE